MKFDAIVRLDIQLYNGRDLDASDLFWNNFETDFLSWKLITDSTRLKRKQYRNVNLPWTNNFFVDYDPLSNKIISNQE